MKLSELFWGFIFCLCVGSTQRACALQSSVIVDFDVDPAGNAINAVGLFSDSQPLTTEYAPLGLIVSGPSPLDGPAILHEVSNFNVPARSGDSFLAFNAVVDATLQNSGRPIGPVDFSFPGRISAFQIHVSGGSNPAVFDLEAFGPMLQSLGVRSVVGPAGGYTLLSFSSATPISLIRIAGDNFADAFVMDDLAFTPIPEPQALALLATPLAGFLTKRRRSLAKSDQEDARLPMHGVRCTACACGLI